MNLSGSGWAERIQDADRNDSRHNQREEMCICAVAPFQIPPLSSFVKRFVLNLLLSDVVRSSCANLLQHVKIKLVTVALVLEAGADRERTSASGWDPCASVRKHFWNLLMPEWNFEHVFSAGDLGTVDCSRDLHSRRKQALCCLSGVVIESGLACQHYVGVNPQSLCQIKEEAENMTNTYMIYSSLIC